MEPPFCRGTKAVFESNRNRVARSAIIDHPQADVNREKHRERVISSGIVLRWKETDAGYRAKARWCVHGFKDIHEIERSCPTPELSSINITLQILALTTRVRWPTVRKHSCKATRVSEMGLCMPLRFPKKLPGVPEVALIRLDREVYGLVSGMSGWRSRIVSQLKEEGYEMNIYIYVCICILEPCLLSKLAVREEPAVDGGTIAYGELVGGATMRVCLGNAAIRSSLYPWAQNRLRSLDGSLGARLNRDESSCWLLRGDLLVMDGCSQDDYQHCTDPRLEGERVNVTSRWICNHVFRCPLGAGVVCCLSTCVKGSSASASAGLAWPGLFFSVCPLVLSGVHCYL